MTRINCVPPAELTDEHLGAEYRELPRVFALAEAAYHRGLDPFTNKYVPKEYTLGRGHVLFFYTRLLWCERRYKQLVEECTFRGRLVSFPVVPRYDVPDTWRQGWVPTEAAKALNRARIQARLSGIKE